MVTLKFALPPTWVLLQPPNTDCSPSATSTRCLKSVPSLLSIYKRLFARQPWLSPVMAVTCLLLVVSQISVCLSSISRQINFCRSPKLNCPSLTANWDKRPSTLETRTNSVFWAKVRFTSTHCAMPSSKVIRLPWLKMTKMKAVSFLKTLQDWKLPSSTPLMYPPLKMSRLWCSTL